MWKSWHLVSASLSAAEGVAAIDRIINVHINGSHLTHDSQTAGVQHEGNAAALRLHFDPGWDGFAKTVTFWNAAGGDPVQRILTADLLEDMAADTRIYRCPIPPEAMTEPGKLTYIIDGMAGDVRQRSVEDTLRVLAAGYAPEAGTPADPTPTRAEQLQVQVDALMGELQQGMAAAEAAKNSAGAAADSEWKAVLAAQEAQDAAADAADSQKAAADSEAAAENAAKRAEGAVAGVASFNGRNGAVMPQSGDYTAAMVGAVALDGSNAMTGALKTPSLQCTALTAPTKIGKFLDFHVADVNTRTCRIYPTDDGRFVFNVPYVGEYFFLHTGNKPSGYYTGNGSASREPIDTKGIGNVCIIYGGAGIAIVTANGAICGGGDGPATPRSLPTSAIRFHSGVLTIKTADSVVNGSGGWYDYYVL